MPGDHSQEGLNAYQFVFDSIRVSAKPELAAYAQGSFASGRPLLEAVFDLTVRIHQDLRALAANVFKVRHNPLEIAGGQREQKPIAGPI